MLLFNNVTIFNAIEIREVNKKIETAFRIKKYAFREMWFLFLWIWKIKNIEIDSNPKVVGSLRIVKPNEAIVIKKNDKINLYLKINLLM